MSAAAAIAAVEAYPANAATPPIFQTSLFTFDNFADMADVYAGRSHRLIYSRGDNPTVMEFERLMAALDGAEAARAFSSGMGAIAATVLAFVSAGDRIVTIRHVYSDAYRMFELLLSEFNVTVDYVDGADVDAVAAALPGARLLYLESPSSMVFELQDIAALAQLARENGVVSVLDNSWATPVFQKPIIHGVDLVIHAASKYLGGHSDTVAGIVSGSMEHIARINRRTFPYLGAKLSPFEAWLLIRGLRTLPLRLSHHMKSGVSIAERLKNHPDVRRVFHPIYSNHRGKGTLHGYSGLFSFEVDDAINVPAFVDALRVFRLGVSWGGPESLVVPALAPLQLPEANSFARFGVSARLIRLHIGFEDVDGLWRDLEQALAQGRL
ncbi:PLP-dependent transferase [Methylocapsa palsarum]|nr:PLP-dependent transferase [Methylocapsa palsarum]